MSGSRRAALWPSGHGVSFAAGGVCWMRGTETVIHLGRESKLRTTAVSTRAGNGTGNDGERQFTVALKDRSNGPGGNRADAMTSHHPVTREHRVNEKDRCANTSPLQRRSFVWDVGSRSDRRQTA